MSIDTQNEGRPLRAPGTSRAGAWGFVVIFLASGAAAAELGRLVISYVLN